MFQSFKQQVQWLLNISRDSSIPAVRSTAGSTTLASFKQNMSVNRQNGSTCQRSAINNQTGTVPFTFYKGPYALNVQMPTTYCLFVPQCRLPCTHPHPSYSIKNPQREAPPPHRNQSQLNGWRGNTSGWRSNQRPLSLYRTRTYKYECFATPVVRSKPVVASVTGFIKENNDLSVQGVTSAELTLKRHTSAVL